MESWTPLKTTRRGIVLSAGASVVALGACALVPARPQAPRLLYIGTQSADPDTSITAARFDSATGAFTLIGPAAPAQKPRWLLAHPQRPILYAAAERREGGEAIGAVTAYGIDGQTGALREISYASSSGRGANFLELDLPSQTLLAANFETGTVAALPLTETGNVGAPVSTQSNFGTGPLPRQASAHAHQIVLDPSRRFALSPDLGADRVFVYRFDPVTRALTSGDPAFEQLPPASGPRHLAFHPGGRFVYVLSEFSCELRAYAWDAANGRMTLMQSLFADGAAGSDDPNRAAEIHATPDGRFLYVSVRGLDLIVVYGIDAGSGTLTELQRIASGGQSPWAFVIDPTGRWMLVANNLSDALAVLARDPETGRLAATATTLSVKRPASIAFAADVDGL